MTTVGSQHPGEISSSEVAISVFLADDNLLVRQGVQTLIEMADDLKVVGVAADFGELVERASEAAPQVLVTDIRMPPSFGQEGIEAAKLLRKRHPGTGVVVLSQHDDPEYAIALLSEGSAGYAYLLKDRVADGDQLVRAIREVAAGGSMLDPKIVDALALPVERGSLLTPSEESLLRHIAGGTPIKAIAVINRTTPADVDRKIDELFSKLAKDLSSGSSVALDRLKDLHRAIMEREEQGEALSRFLPEGVVDKLEHQGRRPGYTEELEVTVLMSDIRGWSTIAEHTAPTVLASQLNRHRSAMSQIIVEHGGTVMQFVGDAVMAVFGDPQPLIDHADKALEAAVSMHDAQADLNRQWHDEGLTPFGIGIGISTGTVAAALIGSDQRMEYTVIGDTVNLAQRLQQWGEPGETVLSEPTHRALSSPPVCDRLEPALVKGRASAVGAYRFPRRDS